MSTTFFFLSWSFVCYPAPPVSTECLWTIKRLLILILSYSPFTLAHYLWTRFPELSPLSLDKVLHVHNSWLKNFWNQILICRWTMKAINTIKKIVCCHFEKEFLKLLVQIVHTKNISSFNREWKRKKVLRIPQTISKQ